MDLRVRALSWVMRRLPGPTVALLGADRLLEIQTKSLGHNPVSDFLMGGLAPGVDAGDELFDGPGGRTRARVYVPRPSAGPTTTAGPTSAGPATAGCRTPLVVNFHGGGWALGNLDQSDWLCSHVSARVRAVVVSVEYRLAPAHRFPAAVDDCYAGLEWAVDRARSWGADPERVGVMGDSAGGNLAAVICLVAKERLGPRISHQALIYPATDLSDSSSASGTAWETPILSPSEAAAFRDHYLGDPGKALDPHASPLLAPDLSGLPPALVQVAEHDPIRGDGIAYARALSGAGVAVRLTEYVDMPHGFMSFPRFCRSARQALAEVCAEQAAALLP